ncbi:hypothetical protein [Snodgrassella alvi]|uniref:hypothetical protein n=1 Tax=Snodgrassella alvi TaxID=1196083 RepID=UPI000C1F6C3D|nr:hypothetical protein [Snodgrassella alvi]PIT42421.1 hypothetical protein BHC53_00180 [Snodgrassella alvi]
MVNPFFPSFAATETNLLCVMGAHGFVIGWLLFQLNGIEIKFSATNKENIYRLTFDYLFIFAPMKWKYRKQNLNGSLGCFQLHIYQISQ